MIKIEQLDRMCTDKLLQATTGRWLLTRPRSICQVDQVISYMTNLLNNKLLFAYKHGHNKYRRVDDKCYKNVMLESKDGHLVR